MARIISKYFRVKEPRAHAVVDPETNAHTVPDPGKRYRSDHILVRTYPWLFESDADADE
jgi:hypothetical protein